MQVIDRYKQYNISGLAFEADHYRYHICVMFCDLLSFKLKLPRTMLLPYENILFEGIFTSSQVFVLPPLPYFYCFQMNSDII